MANPGAIFITALLFVPYISMVQGQTTLCDFTVGGGRGADGAPCQFPFTFKGNEYSACTVADSANQPWCYTVPNAVENESPWGYCVYDDCTSTTTTPTTTTTTAVTTTTTKCSVFTVDGDACVFPFTYNGATYQGCTISGHNKLWCSTTANYVVDGKWGDCIIYTDKNSAPCVFPYSVIVGTTSRTYNTCTTDYTSEPICGIESSIIIGGPYMAYCQPEGYCPSHFPTPTPTTSEPVGPVGPVGPTSGRVQCSVPVIGGSATPGSMCRFPFVYNEVTYKNCTDVSWNQPWCATGNDLATDNLYGNCIIRTVTGAKCYFPFTYNGKEYSQCTGDDQMALWCATAYVFAGFSSSAWGFCDIRYEPRCSVPNTVPPGQSCPVTYETVLNTLSLFGQNQTYRSNDLCREGCTQSASCMAFDFDFNFLECFFHTDGFMSNIRTTAVVNVNQYRKRPCDQTPTTISVSGCVDTFTRMQNTLSFKGFEMPSSMSTVASCEARCLSNSGCAAFDFDNTLRRCYIHNDGYLAFVQMNQAGVDQYRRIVCQTPGSTNPPGCVPTYKMLANTKSFGGKQSKNVVDANGCKRVCNSNPKCVALDFDNLNMQCFIHEAGFLNNLDSQSPGVDQHRKDTSNCDSASDCKDTFRIFQDHQSPGGVQLSEVTTAESCMEACLRISDCVAFDFDLALSKCYYHKSGFEVTVNTYDDGVRGVNQYRRQTCDSAQDSTTTGVKVPPTSAPPTDLGALCTYERVTNTHSFMGTELEGVSTQFQCDMACSARKPPCPAYDFNMFTDKCYTHNDDYLSMVEAADRIDQYRLVKCECRNSYVVEPNTMAYGGISQGDSITQVSGCQAACEKDVNCLGFDYNRAQKLCYLHNANTINLKAYGGSDVDHYKKVPCETNSNCVLSYDKYSDTLSTGGTPNGGADSQSACERVCTADSNCQAFDFDIFGSKCWLHGAGYLNNVKTSAYGVRDVDQYRKKPCDNGASQGGSLKLLEPDQQPLLLKTLSVPITRIVTLKPEKTSMRPAVIQAPVTLAPARKITQKLTTTGELVTPCAPVYKIQVVSFARGGRPMPGVMSLSACYGQCNLNPTCAGFDYHENQTCVIHTETSILNRIYDYAGVSNYEKVTCFTSQFKAIGKSGGRSCGFRYFEGRKSHFGRQQLLVHSLADCRNKCSQDTTCQAFDFNHVRKNCFVHRSSFASFVANDKDFNQYVKQC